MVAKTCHSAVRDVTVFHAHQCVEKMIKAALIALRTQPPRTHDLTELLARLPVELREDHRLREACRGLQALWPNSRYPHKPIPTSEQVDHAAAWAKQSWEIVGALISAKAGPS
jgi:HEPN domain-containing protein